jgi:hypothetical protein
MNDGGPMKKLTLNQLGNTNLFKASVTSIILLSLVACNPSQSKPQSKLAGQASTNQKPTTPPAGSDTNNNPKLIAPKTQSIQLAKDNVVTTLLNKIATEKDVKQKQKNIQAAASILSINSKISKNTVLVQIKLKGEKDKVITESLGGFVSSNARRVILSNLNTDEGQLKGNLLCLDADFPNFCTTSILELNSRDEKNHQRVFAVIRKTDSSFSLLEQNTYDKTSEDYSSLYNVFVNGAFLLAKPSDSVSELQVASAEVINGKTLVQLNIVTDNKQVISLGGEIKQVVDTNIVESELEKDINPDFLGSLIDRSEIRTSLQSKIQNAQIIQVINGTDLNMRISTNGITDGSRQTLKLLIHRKYPTLIKL